jgi:hypothetical protein
MKVRLAPALTALVLMGQGCVSSVAPSSIGLYGNVAGPQKVKGSSAQAVSTRTVNYDQADTVEAITKSFNMMGLDFEVRDDKTGICTGRGSWNAPGQVTPCTTPYTFAVYVKQIDNKPTSTLTVLIDRHSVCGGALHPQEVLMSQVMASFAKVLMTF